LVYGTPNVAVVVAKRVSDGEVVRWCRELEMTSSADRVLRPDRQISPVWISTKNSSADVFCTLGELKQHGHNDTTVLPPHVSWIYVKPHIPGWPKRDTPFNYVNTMQTSDIYTVWRMLTLIYC